MKTDYITRSKGGTGERKERLDSLKIPDLWHVETFVKGDKEKVLDCWHLAADLKRELLDRKAEHDALVAVAEAAAKYQDKVDGMTNSEFVNGKHFAEAIVLREALSTLAAVYKQSPTTS